jgi:hypothetical protein
LTFEPSNGLGPALADAGNQTDISLPVGTRIDTDSGVVQDANGPIAVKTIVLQQSGTIAPIRVFEAKSFSMQDVTFTGVSPVAFVASGPIVITGRMSARASGSAPASGAQDNAACDGHTAAEFSCVCSSLCSVGMSGAGNFQVGGTGGGNSQTTLNGGGALTAFSPLLGGCFGGSVADQAGATIVHHGGGGGGAIQVVSLTRVELSGNGLIDVGGGGGDIDAGGGSGGLVIVEAPTFIVSGASAGVAANGGSGGGCGMTGVDSTPNTSPAVAPVCDHYFGGNGGTGGMTSGDACVFNLNCTTSGSGVCPINYGGGGGSVGRMRVTTRDGTVTASGNPILSVGISTATLVPK